MKSLAAALLAATLLAAVTPVGVAAHFGSSAYIIVTDDHVLPGEDFDVIASDLSPGATVTFRMVYGEMSVPLTTTTAPSDGHFQLSMALPADFPTGVYGQLFAKAGDGTEVSTWVLVGARTGATPPPPDSAPWWADPSVFVLVGILVGVIAAVALMALRRRAARSALIPVTDKTARRAVNRRRTR